MTNTTQEELLPTNELLIPAAEKYAETYEGDDRDGVVTDVLNAYYAGAQFVRNHVRRTPPAEQPTPDQRRIESMRGQIKALCPELRDIGRDDLADKCIEIAGDMAYVPAEQPAAEVGISKMETTQPAAEGMTDAEIVRIAEECGHCTIIEDAGYENDALWFNGSLIPFARAIEAHLASKRDGEADTRRLDWLAQRVVDVREPGTYGSNRLFLAVPEIDEEGISPLKPSELRDMIDHANPASIYAHPPANQGADHIRDATKMVEKATGGVEGHKVVVTCNEAGQCVCVSRQDPEGRIHEVIWEAEKATGSGAMTAQELADDDALRFIQRVLESNAPESDRKAARNMALEMRMRFRQAIAQCGDSGSYDRGFRDGYNRRDDEVKGCLV